MQKLKIKDQLSKTDKYFVKSIFLSDVEEGELLALSVGQFKKTDFDIVLYMPFEKGFVEEFNEETIFSLLFQNLPNLRLLEVDLNSNELKVVRDSSVVHREVLALMLDYLVSTLGGYEAIIPQFNLTGAFTHYVLEEFGIERHEKEIFQEIVTASEIKAHAKEIVKLYKSFSIPNYPEQIQKDINFIFWSILTMLSSANNLVLHPDDKRSFTTFAMQHAPLTLESLLEAVETSLPYFDKDNLKYEVGFLKQENIVHPQRKTAVVQNSFIYQGKDNYTVSIAGLGRIKSLISILYRNYLPEKEQDERIMKVLDLEISQKVIEMCPFSGKEYEASQKVLNDLFELKLIKPKNSLNLDIQIVFDDKVLEKIESEPLMS